MPIESTDLWSDVLLVEGEEMMLTYRTGMVVYEESLTKGSFVARGWNGSGLVNFYDGRVNPAASARRLPGCSSPPARTRQRRSA